MATEGSAFTSHEHELGENQQQLVIGTNGLIDLLVDLPASLNVVRRFIAASRSLLINCHPSRLRLGSAGICFSSSVILSEVSAANVVEGPLSPPQTAAAFAIVLEFCHHEAQPRDLFSFRAVTMRVPSHVRHPLRLRRPCSVHFCGLSSLAQRGICSFRCHPEDATMNARLSRGTCFLLATGYWPLATSFEMFRIRHGRVTSLASAMLRMISDVLGRPHSTRPSPPSQRG